MMGSNMSKNIWKDLKSEMISHDTSTLLTRSWTTNIENHFKREFGTTPSLRNTPHLPRDFKNEYNDRDDSKDSFHSDNSS
jgi:hypothetical protein